MNCVFSKLQPFFLYFSNFRATCRCLTTRSSLGLISLQHSYRGSRPYTGLLQRHRKRTRNQLSRAKQAIRKTTLHLTQNLTALTSHHGTPRLAVHTHTHALCAW